MKPILVVDDDSEMRAALRDAIQRLGYTVVLCEDGYEAVNKLSQSYYSLLITDMKMPRMDGLSLLKEMRKKGHNIPVLVITGFGTVENAVETMKEGAIDYLLKPFSFESLKSAIESIIRKTSLEKEIIFKNPEMQKIINLAGNLAMSDITVLIFGESGTGKELLARYIHKKSKRSDKPFVAVNCAAIPDNLLESELFGYEKGAFTGATEKRKGKFELANGGTILLDEIGEMSMTLQAKLLRVLQEREIDRIGGKEPISIDVRVIATTNRDLEKECIEGRFREDLYYRLNVFPLKVPALRDRPEDIEILAEHFLRKFSLNYAKNIEAFDDEAMEYLMSRKWRGNVRELENIIQRAVFVCSERYISIKDLIIYDNSNSDSKININGSLKDLERELILKTLKDVGGNKTKAAKILGLSVRTIRNKLNEYGKIFPDEINF
jgi:DNA-binding NtrC family response regulator